MGQQKNRTGKDKRSTSGRLRIVAGKWRRRLLPVADETGLRPTPERVRETLFNWLSPQITGKKCLDLFAGSGALGFEALSRGAASVVFVENSRRVAAMLRDNFNLLEASGAVLHEGDAKAYIDSDTTEKFEIVFLDPPFAADMLEDLCRLLAESGKLSSDAKIYLEQERHQSFPELPAGWIKIKDKVAGNVRYALVDTSGFEAKN